MWHEERTTQSVRLRDQKFENINANFEWPEGSMCNAGGSSWEV